MGPGSGSDSAEAEQPRTVPGLSAAMSSTAQSPLAVIHPAWAEGRVQLLLLQRDPRLIQRGTAQLQDTSQTVWRQFSLYNSPWSAGPRSRNTETSTSFPCTHGLSFSSTNQSWWHPQDSKFFW